MECQFLEEEMTKLETIIRDAYENSKGLSKEEIAKNISIATTEALQNKEVTLVEVVEALKVLLAPSQNIH